ncbi:MAG: Maf family protein [Firmicutes bacterium]|uniref:dTTP/UTP pyrophosphatase n=2 Tax=Candidatus Colimorpha enterica TaxID=3083063 RepID=A0AAE3FGZ3_9BACT|nr:Maf family protein [Candidatus Colimorpha enterica]MDY2905605.1 Maf family protein [Eubacteriales bacterium]
MKKIILASKSPRRLELLRMLGLNVETASPDIDESAVEADSPSHLAEKLAKTKAEKVYRDLHPEGCPVVAADTLVEIGGKILGKPRSVAEAGEMLRMLSGKLHYVHTGLAVIYSGTFASAVETATVHFRELSDDEIESYIMSGEPMDKAGAYGIQGRAGAFVDRIEGDFFSIVGLPLCRLVTLLRNTMGLTLSDMK